MPSESVTVISGRTVSAPTGKVASVASVVSSEFLIAMEAHAQITSITDGDVPTVPSTSVTLMSGRTKVPPLPTVLLYVASEFSTVASAQSPAGVGVTPVKGALQLSC